jgi:hypothetical protein
MPAKSSLPTRRVFLASSAAAGASSVIPAAVRAASEGNAIRSFRIDIPEEALVDLRRRISATRWPFTPTLATARSFNIRSYLSPTCVSFSNLTCPSNATAPFCSHGESR